MMLKDDTLDPYNQILPGECDALMSRYGVSVNQVIPTRLNET